jgi:hypothetical protein
LSSYSVLSRLAVVVEPRGRHRRARAGAGGTTTNEDTTRAPSSVSEARAHWITRYLNARFLWLPEHVEVLVREPHAKAD